MQNTTFDLVKAAIRCDPSITPVERARILAGVRGHDDPPAAPAQAQVPSWIRTREAAHRLACSPRTIARLAKDGYLTRRRLPGRTRSAGYLVSDIDALALAGGGGAS